MSISTHQTDLKTISIALHEQLLKTRSTILISLLVGCSGIILVYGLSHAMGVSPGWLTRDPAAVTGSSPYIGMLSNLGIMAWTSATAILFWVALLLSGNKRFRNSALFMFTSGVLCLFLTIDDAFMVHEELLPSIHIPEKALYLGYLLFLIGYGWYFFRRILNSDYLLLVLAFSFLGLSVVIDFIFPFTDLEAFLEDSPKFIGIVFWLAYFSRTALAIVRETYSEYATEHKV